MTAKACTGMGLNPSTSFEICKQIYTSGLFSKIKLSNSSKLVIIAMGNHYNPNKPDIFPSIKYLASQLGIGDRSVARAIVELKNAGLIIYETKNVNRYRFTNIFFEMINMAVVTCQNDKPDHAKMACKHIRRTNNKQIHIKTNKLASENKQVNDDILNKLSSWNYLGGQFIIKKHGREIITKLIELVESKKPDNKGAYLRKLLENPVNALKENNIELDNDRIKRLLEDKTSFLNDKFLAKIQLSNYHPNHLQSIKTLKHIAEIQVRWNFPENYLLDVINLNPKYFETYTALVRAVKESFLSLGYNSYIAS